MIFLNHEIINGVSLADYAYSKGYERLTVFDWSMGVTEFYTVEFDYTKEDGYFPVVVHWRIVKWDYPSCVAKCLGGTRAERRFSPIVNNIYKERTAKFEQLKLL